MNLSQSLLKSLWNYIMGFLKRGQIRICRIGCLYWLNKKTALQLLVDIFPRWLGSHEIDWFDITKP